MSEMTLGDIYRAARKLPPEEQAELARRLQTGRQATVKEDEELGLLVFDVGPWPEDLPLRREDMYDDDGR